jgi:hypothetical protein
MLEVIARSDGSFAVSDTGGHALDPTLAVFPTAVEADEWMLQAELRRDSRNDGLGVMLPGADQWLA